MGWIQSGQVQVMPYMGSLGCGRLGSGWVGLVRECIIFVKVSSSFFFSFFQVLKEDSVLIVTTKRSNLDKCPLPIGLRLFVSASHSESDLLKAAASLKRVATSILS